MIGVLLQQDTFNGRSVSGSFGTSSDGNTYSVVSFSRVVVGVSGNEGNIYYDNSGGGYGSYLVLFGSQTAIDVTAALHFSFGTLAGSPEIGIYLRYIDANNWYKLRLFNGVSGVQFQKNVAGTVTSVIIDKPTFVAGAYYFVRFQVWNNTLAIKIWSAASEPAVWNYLLTDTSITSAGQFGLAFTATGTTAQTGISIDSYNVNAVQSAGDTIIHGTGLVLGVPNAVLSNQIVTVESAQILRSISIR